MAAETWGLMPKSQEDPETIEEAIERLIAEHEADESAHLGTGESLQSHKASEIIDHAAASVVEDKILSGAVTTEKLDEDRQYTKFTFESWSGWNFDEEGVESGIVPAPGCMGLYAGVDLADFMYMSNESPAAPPSCAKSPEMEAVIDLHEYPDDTAFAMTLGAIDGFNPTDAVGFRWDGEDEEMICFYAIDGVETTFVIAGYDPDVIHRLRIAIADNGDTLNFYVDGELVKSWTEIGFAFSSFVWAFFGVNLLTQNETAGAIVRGVLFIQDW